MSDFTSPPAASASLAQVYLGWNGYNTSLIKAIESRTAEELDFRPAADQSSVGELARHIVGGRLSWFLRMSPPLGEEVSAQVPAWTTDGDGNRHIVESALPMDAAGLVHWLELTWRMIDATLNAWTVDDLVRTYRHTYWGKTYAVSYQWTIWRILTHDVHHGGQLSLMLYLQGIEIPELGALGGHLTEPELVP